MARIGRVKPKKRKGGAKIGRITVGEVTVSHTGEARGIVTFKWKTRPFRLHYLFGYWRMVYRQEWTEGLTAEEIQAVFGKIAEACDKKRVAPESQGETIEPSE